MRPRNDRLRRLAVAGLVDSFGLSVGWTVAVLHLEAERGLMAVGAVNAAMLVGVALSAPVTGWLAARVGGRGLLQGTALVEASLRVGVFAVLLSGAPLPLLALIVLVSNVVAWTGYAVMRAEVAEADHRATAMTWYVVGIAAVEALGVAIAALLPIGPGTDPALLIGTVAVYAGALLPTLRVSVGARTLPTAAPWNPPGRAGAATSGLARRRVRLPPGLLDASAVTVLTAGPTLLSVALAAQLHGRVAVAPAAVAFIVGSLLAPMAADGLDRAGVPWRAALPLLGVGMIAGWVLAPLHLAGLLVAQMLSGISMGALEGVMDARASRDDVSATTGLATTAAGRALGGAVAVALLPQLLVLVPLERFSAVVAVGLSVLVLAALPRAIIRSWSSDPAA